MSCAALKDSKTRGDAPLSASGYLNAKTRRLTCCHLRLAAPLTAASAYSTGYRAISWRPAAKSHSPREPAT